MLEMVHIRKKILRAMLIVIITMLALIGCVNNTIAYHSSDLVYFGTQSEFDARTDLYCMDYGYPYAGSDGLLYYYKYADGIPLDSTMAYIIYQAQTGKIDKREAQIYVWNHIQGGQPLSTPPADNQDLIMEAQTAQNTNISINGITDGSLVYEATPGNGKYGPFNVTYPCYTKASGEIGYPDGQEVKVLLNGNELSFLPNSGEDFYLTEADGIKVGEKNVIQVAYKGYTAYSGTYSRWAPERLITCERQCTECQEVEVVYKRGAYVNGRIIVNEDVHWTIDYFWGLGHEDYCPVPATGYRDEYYVYRNYQVKEVKKHQDLIQVNAVRLPVQKTTEVNFWPGRKIVVNLNKTDNATIGNPLSGIQFDISLKTGAQDTYFLGSDGARSTSISLETDGTAKTLTIITYDSTVELSVQELLNILYVDNGNIDVTLTLTDPNNNTWEATQSSSAKDGFVQIKKVNDCEFNLNIKNQLKIENFKLIKVNKGFNNEKIEGIKFIVRITNATSSKISDGQEVITDANGEIDFGTLEITDPNEPVTIDLQESGYPTSGLNFKPGGIFTITINHNNSAGLSQTVAGGTSEVNYDLATNTVVATIDNIVTLDLSGQVWLDGQTGIKPVKEPNGLKDSRESGVAGVKVILKKYADKSIVKEVVTGSDGKYEFKDIPTSAKGNIQYYIEFVYDGIHYVETIPGGDSKAHEIDRANYNARFGTIEKDKTQAGEPLSYNYSSDKAEIITLNNDGTVLDNFKMVAETNNQYNKNTNNIDFGLVKKSVDLEAVTELNEVVVKINGESKTYNYNDISQIRFEQDGLTISRDAEPNYPLYLYSSDYNYRINHYTDLPILNDAAHLRFLGSADQDSDLLKKKQTDGELELEFTYQVVFNNQSATPAKINQIAYYYDPALKLVDPAGTPVETVKIGDNQKEYKKIVCNIGTELGDVQQALTTLKFITKPGTVEEKDSNGKVIETWGLGDINDIKNNGKDISTWVEIISYSTNQGCIDEDSAPDDLNGGQHLHEDDTAEAKGLPIYIKGQERQISGYVFEDVNKDGEYSTEDITDENTKNLVNDVIVQLIEIKNVDIKDQSTGVTTTYKLEYIWQETVTGYNVGKRIKTDGSGIETYDVSGASDQYTFQGFIPGQYIVRFIYGDGTYFDKKISITGDDEPQSANAQANLLKYNGQDYKSTYDAYYTSDTWEPNTYKANASMARDNEARRLEEMEYATGHPDDLIIDSKEELQNTWMCAETSLVNIPVDEGSPADTLLRNINFGLAQRERAKLYLEKHLTYLKIDGVTEASVNHNSLEDYYAGVQQQPGEGLKNVASFGEAVTVYGTSNKNTEDGGKIGEWKVETTSSSISQKDMNIGYTYFITNKGDKEYIGQQLNQELESGSTYGQIAQQLKAEMLRNNYPAKVTGSYISEAYYNHNYQGFNDIEVPIKVKLEDYLEANQNFNIDGNAALQKVGAQKSVAYLKLYGGNDAEQDKSENINVQVIQSDDIEIRNEQKIDFNIHKKLDQSGGATRYTYRSYVANLIEPKVSKSGVLPLVMKADGSIGQIGNTIQYVKTEDDTTPQTYIAPENDEFVAETVVITYKTGEDKQSPVMLIVSIAAGLTIVAAGTIIIKRFIVK